MTRRLTVAIALLMFLAVASSAFAAAATKTAPSKPAPSKTVTLELTDTTVVEAVESLFKGTSLSYILQPGVGGTISSLRIKDVTFEKALNALMKASGLEANLEDGIYIIGKAVTEPVPTLAVTEQPKPAAGTDQVVAAQPVLPDQEYQPGYGPVMDPYYGPMGPVSPDGAPVYYGPTGPEGYYPGYNYGFNPYGFYGQPRVIVPGVQSPMRVGSRNGSSSGIGKMRIHGSPNMQYPR